MAGSPSFKALALLIGLFFSACQERSHVAAVGVRRGQPGPEAAWRDGIPPQMASAVRSKAER